MKFLVYSGNGTCKRRGWSVRLYWIVKDSKYGFQFHLVIYRQPKGGNLKPKSERSIIIDVSRCGF